MKKISMQGLQDIDPPALPHIEQITDRELNALLDRYLFGYPQWCMGQPYQPSTTPTEYRCNTCAASLVVDGQFEQTMMLRYFSGAKHKRVAPIYRVEQIGAQMMVFPQHTQFQFVLAVRVALTGDGIQRSVTAEFANLLANLSPRLLGRAALNAIGIINARGYFYDQAGGCNG